MEIEAHPVPGFLTGPVAHGVFMLEQFVPDGLWAMERTQIEAVHEGLYPMWGIPHWSRGTV